MGGLAARMTLGAIGLCLAVLCSGCAWWDRPAFTNAMSSSAPPSAMASTDALEPAPRASPETLRPLPAISNEPEDFLCLDGSRMRISYLPSGDSVAVSLNGARPIALRREDEAGLTAYRASNLVLRRSGVRVALASAAVSVTVQSGDTLGTIALRAYGDRMRAMDIARVNNIANPDLIFPGQVLDLPQAERRCRRTQHQEASYVPDAGVGIETPQPLNRRLFSPPSARQPDQQRVRATASDPPLR
jgi:LysM repeat protein